MSGKGEEESRPGSRLARHRPGLPRAAHICAFLSIHIPWLDSRGQSPCPSLGTAAFYTQPEEGQEFWLAQPPADLSREACRRPCLPSPPEPGLPGPVQSEAGPPAAALHGLLHPCSLQGHRQLSRSPCSRGAFPFPPLPFPGPELGTSFYSCSRPTLTCRPVRCHL